MAAPILFTAPADDQGVAAPVKVRPDVAALRQLVQKFTTWNEDKLFQALQKFYVNQDDVFYSSFAARDSTITDVGIRIVCKLFQNSLKMLDLTRCENISREGIREISGLVNLRVLNLTKCRLTPEDLSCLRGISSLKSLKLAYIDGITDGIVELLSSLDGLEDLDLTKTKVTLKGIALISESPASKSLRRLYISGAPAGIVAKASLVDYSKSSNMTDILANFTKLNELFIGPLSTMTEIQAIKDAIGRLLVTVTISTSGVIELSRSSDTFTEPLANRVEAPAELVTLLQSIKPSTKSPVRFKPPVPYPIDGGSFSSFDSPIKNQVNTAKLRLEAAFSPRRSPRLVSKRQSASTAQSIASPRRTTKAKSTTVSSSTPTPSPTPALASPTPKKSNLKKRIRSDFENIETPDSAAKRARRVIFTGVSPPRSPTRRLSLAHNDEASSSSAAAMEVDSEGSQSPVQQEQPLLAPPTGQGLFGFLKGMFF